MAKGHHPSVSAIAAIAERMLEGIADHPIAQRLQGEVIRLSAGAEALANFKASRSPLDTPAAHALKVAERTRKYEAEVKASFQRSIQLWAAAHADAQRRISEKVDLRPDSFAPEIRQRFMALSGKAQAKLIQELVDGNRGPELAAIVKAPPLLTGINEQQRAGYEHAIVARHASAELDEQTRLADVHQAAITANDAARELVGQFLDPSTLAAIERSAAEADEAADAFDQSLQ